MATATTASNSSSTVLYGNLTTPQASTYDYVLPFTQEWVIASTVILVLFLLFGVSANSITIAVIRKSPRLQNRYYLILSSLCVSDILSALVSILFLYRRIWGFLYFAWPEFFCRLYWGLDLWTSFSTALHILSFAILRLIGVQWPTKFKRLETKHMRLWLACVWISTFFFGFIPHFIFNTVRVIDRDTQPEIARWASCSLADEWIATWQVYVQFAYAICLYVPALSIIGISIAIAVILRKRRFPPGDKTSAPFVSISTIVENRHTLRADHPSGTPMSSRATSPRNSASGTPVLNNDRRLMKNGHVNPHADSLSGTPMSSRAPSPRNSAPGTPVLKSDRRLVSNRQTAAQRRWKKDRRAIYQLFLIVGSFLFGYIPLTAFHFYTGFTMDDSSQLANAIDWRFAMVQYILLRFSECLNPIFYNLASKKMREETMKMLKRALRLSSRFTTTCRDDNVHHRHAKSSSGI